MARKPVRPGPITSAQKAQRERRQQFEADNAKRSKSETLLDVSSILQGEVDAGSLLRFFTTDGGQLRQLTQSDIAEFKARRDQLQDRFKRGIKIADVINLSDPVDRQRATKEIANAIPMASKAGTLKFMTDTGPNSDRDRHYVMVELRNFEAAATSPKPSALMAKEVLKGPVAVACSCGRWRYWYAYMATAGGYNANPEHKESAFPKIRNPKLRGIACKHILRTMQALKSSPSMTGFVSRHIEQERDKVSSRERRVSQAEMAELVEQMSKDSRYRKQVTSAEERKIKLKQQPSYQQREMARAERTKAASARRAAEKERKRMENDVKKARAQLKASLDLMLSLGQMSQEVYEQMLKGGGIA